MWHFFGHGIQRLQLLRHVNLSSLHIIHVYNVTEQTWIQESHIQDQDSVIYQDQVNSALHPYEVVKWVPSTNFGWGKVTTAEWQVTLCDGIKHVIYLSGEVISITNCYMRLNYLLTWVYQDQDETKTQWSNTQTRGRQDKDLFTGGNSPMQNQRYLVRKSRKIVRNGKSHRYILSIYHILCERE